MTVIVNAALPTYGEVEDKLEPIGNDLEIARLGNSNYVTIRVKRASYTQECTVRVADLAVAMKALWVEPS